MPVTRKNPYSFRSNEEFVFKALRVQPAFWDHLELIAARERVSMNAAINALLSLALEWDQEEEGRDAIHDACQQWRTRWEHKLTARRKAKVAADDPTLL